MKKGVMFVSHYKQNLHILDIFEQQNIFWPEVPAVIKPTGKPKATTRTNCIFWPFEKNGPEWRLSRLTITFQLLWSPFEDQKPQHIFCHIIYFQTEIKGKKIKKLVLNLTMKGVEGVPSLLRIFKLIIEFGPKFCVSQVW